MPLNFSSRGSRIQAVSAFIGCCFFANLGLSQPIDPTASDSTVVTDSSLPSSPTAALAGRDNDPNLKHSVTPYRWRLSLDIGDQAGGPVRYNTRFPNDAEDPNPGSYYHAQAFAGVSGEYAFAKGALQVGVFTRRDLAHGNIAGRSYSGEGVLWTVDKIAFKSDGVAIGWVLGRAYREAPWKLSLATVADRTHLSMSLKSEKGQEKTVDVSMWAASLRSRVMFRMLGRGSADLHIGPELHVPIYAHTTKPSLDSEEGRLAQIADVKNSAAIGLIIEIGLKG